MSLDALQVGYARAHPAEVAALLRQQDVAEVSDFCLALPDAVAARLMATLPHGLARQVLEAADAPRTATLLEAASFDDAAGLLTRVSPEQRDQLIAGIPSPKRRKMLTRRFAFEDGTLGAIACRDLISVPLSATLRDVADEVNALSITPGEEPPIYLLGDGGRLQGELDLYQALETEDLDLAVEHCMLAVEPLPAEMPLDAGLRSPRWNKASILPVVDRNRFLLGTVTVQQIREATRPDSPASGFGIVVDLSERFIEMLGGLIDIALSPRGRK